MKTVERAHLPAKMWERIKLSGNYTKALEQVRSSLYDSIGRRTDIDETLEMID